MAQSAGPRIIQVEEKLPLLETIPLSLQHLFAMFGATVLVPFLFKVNPAMVKVAGADSGCPLKSCCNCSTGV